MTHTKQGSIKSYLLAIFHYLVYNLCILIGLLLYLFLFGLTPAAPFVFLTIVVPVSAYVFQHNLQKRRLGLNFDSASSQDSSNTSYVANLSEPIHQVLASDPGQFGKFLFILAAFLWPVYCVFLLLLFEGVDLIDKAFMVLQFSFWPITIIWMIISSQAHIVYLLVALLPVVLLYVSIRYWPRIWARAIGIVTVYAYFLLTAIAAFLGIMAQVR